jgi:hypothetical protein
MPAPRPDLSDVVADPVVARLLADLRAALPRLHGEVRVTETPVDLRAEFRGALVCRVVPYRELLHIQVGENPMWETRLRTAYEFPHVVDRIVRTFLRAYAHAPTGAAHDARTDR